MVERRKPLILSSTRTLLDSVLNSARSGGIKDGGGGTDRRDRASGDQGRPGLRLTAGILRFADDGAGGDELKENSHLVGVSASVLKRLSITAGSLVAYLFLYNWDLWLLSLYLSHSFGQFFDFIMICRFLSKIPILM